MIEELGSTSELLQKRKSKKIKNILANARMFLFDFICYTRYMFRQDELQLLKCRTLTIISIDDRTIDLRSNRTGDMWRIIKNVVSGTDKPITIQHKHNRDRNKWHIHWKCYSVEYAIREIKQHDKYEIGRRKAAEENQK